MTRVSGLFHQRRVFVSLETERNTTVAIRRLVSPGLNPNSRAPNAKAYVFTASQVVKLPPSQQIPRDPACVPPQLSHLISCPIKTRTALQPRAGEFAAARARATRQGTLSLIRAILQVLARYLPIAT